MSNIIDTIESDWSVAVNVIQTLLKSATDASPLLTDLKISLQRLKENLRLAAERAQ